MSLPFFDALQQGAPPDTGIDIIAKTSVQEVFHYHPAVRRIHAFTKPRGNSPVELLRFGKSLRQFGPYDLFITLPSSFSSALIGYGVKSRVRLGFKGDVRFWLLTHRFTQRRGLHRARSYRYLLQDAEPSLQRVWPELRFSQARPPQRISFAFSEEERQRKFLQPDGQTRYIVFNVNSEAQSRRLPLKTWIALGTRLLQQEHLHITLVFVGAPGEKARVSEVAQALMPQNRVLDLSGKTSVRDLAMVLRDADAVVSNDSGPMHLANAVGTPLVTFLGAAEPSETEPFNSGKTIVINKHLPCSPCVKNVCRFSSVRCLEQISVDDIYNSLLSVSGLA